MIKVKIEIAIPAPTEASVKVEPTFIIFMGWDIWLTEFFPVIESIEFKHIKECWFVVFGVWSLAALLSSIESPIDFLLTLIRCFWTIRVMNGWRRGRSSWIVSVFPNSIIRTLLWRHRSPTRRTKLLLLIKVF